MARWQFTWASSSSRKCEPWNSGGPRWQGNFRRAPRRGETESEFASPPENSRRIRRKRLRAGAGTVVGPHVDQRDGAAVDLALRAVERRADCGRLVDIFTVAAERLRHLVEARVA